MPNYFRRDLRLGALYVAFIRNVPMSHVYPNRVGARVDRVKGLGTFVTIRVRSFYLDIDWN